MFKKSMLLCVLNKVGDVFKLLNNEGCIVCAKTWKSQIATFKGGLL